MPSDNSNDEVLRIDVDGNWSATDMAHFFQTCDELHCFHVYFSYRVHERLAYEIDRSFLHGYWRHDLATRFLPFGFGTETDHLGKDLLSFVSSSCRDINDGGWMNLPELQVKRIQYGSKGFSDLVGLGEAIKQIKEFVFKIIDSVKDYRKLKRELEMADLKNQEERIKIQTLEIENEEKRRKLALIDIEIEERRKKLEALDLENRKKEVEIIDHQVRVLRDVGASQRIVRQAITAIGDRAEVIRTLALDGKLVSPPEVGSSSVGETSKTETESTPHNAPTKSRRKKDE